MKKFWSSTGLGRDGLTHNMLDLIHTHIGNDEVLSKLNAKVFLLLIRIMFAVMLSCFLMDMDIQYLVHAFEFFTNFIGMSTL